ncbi:MAG TPA: glycosyltransferase [Gammaproteobacteria bacterium]
MFDSVTGNRPLRVFTWHIHGSYLYYLSQTPVEFIIPVKSNGAPGYTGRSGPFPWGTNVTEIPAEEVCDTDFDCVLYQQRKNYLEDQYEILSDEQRQLPRIYLEHDPPRDVPTDTRHFVDDPTMLIVHVTHFNRLMWDNNRTPARVIEHAVLVPPDARYSGELEKGIVVINNIHSRGRRLGLDVYKNVRKHVPLDIVGMGSEEVGGLGEIPPPELPAFISRYRFFFNPIRYTSLGLAVCEAMMVGLPMIGLATTEMPVTVDNGVSGYVHTDVDFLVEKMHLLLRDPKHAHDLSHGARAAALRKFDMRRFTDEWLATFESVTRSAQMPQARLRNG